MIAAPPRPKTSLSGSSAGKSSGNAERGMYCGHRDDEGARLDRDVAHARQPAVGVVGGGRHPDLGAGAVDRVAGERHPVLPADQAADPAQRRLGRREVVAGADAVEEPLVVGRHQLAVLPDEALGADQQQGVVEAARPLGLALVDPDRDVDVVLGAGRGEPVRERAGHVHRVRPEPLPELVEAVEGGGGLRPGCPTGRAGRRSRAARRAGRRLRRPRRSGRPPSRRSPRHRGSRASPGWPRPGRCRTRSCARAIIAET